VGLINKAGERVREEEGKRARLLACFISEEGKGGGPTIFLITEKEANQAVSRHIGHIEEGLKAGGGRFLRELSMTMRAQKEKSLLKLRKKGRGDVNFFGQKKRDKGGPLCPEGGRRGDCPLF